jgi:GNAT superfamily N-acetyltransferase
MSSSPKPEQKKRLRIVAAGRRKAQTSRELWRGLLRFNRQAAGPFHYSRVVLTATNEAGRIVGGLIIQSYWRETYIELLWMSGRARGMDGGTALIREAERRAKKRGSVLIHLNTYSFQAPRFYEKMGYRRFGSMRGSPKGHGRHFYVKRLRPASS